MPKYLVHGTEDFFPQLRELVGRKAERSPMVAERVANIIEQVRAQGDDALISLTAQLDGHDLTCQSMRLDRDQIQESLRNTPTALIEALEFAAERIRRFHMLQIPKNISSQDGAGGHYALRWVPVDAAGLYVPGGQASYPSSVLMNAIPAITAGVGRLAMVVPTPNGQRNDAVIAAAHVAGVGEIYCVGGAQAVAALALGTDSIAPVDVIVGPGNAYVAEAKRQLFGQVGIDMVAGPSEVLVVADQGFDPAIAAMDLLAQAEHDADAQSILLTDDAAYADRVEQAVRQHLETLPRAGIAGKSWENNGGLLVAPRNEFANIINMIAPEHLELAISMPEEISAKVRHAGAIFMGNHTPEAVGDYVGGPNHVLPTSGSARFSSGLSVFDFLKRSTVLTCTPQSLGHLGPVAATLADAEGLSAHALSVRMRLDGGDSD